MIVLSLVQLLPLNLNSIVRSRESINTCRERVFTRDLLQEDVSRENFAL